MKRLFKWFFRLVLLTLVAAAVVVLLRNQLLRVLLEHRLTEFTGCRTVIGSVEIGLKQPRVTFRDVRLFNPDALSLKPFLDIPRARLDYVPQALLSRQLIIPVLEVQVESIQLFRKDLGRSTQMYLKQHLDRARDDQRSPFRPLAFQEVGSLRLSASKFAYFDYVQMTLCQEASIGLKDCILTNLTSLSQLLPTLERIAENKGIRWPPLDAPPAPAKPPTDG